LTAWLTSEARAELSQDLQMIGGGLATTVGRIGEVGFSLAGSHSDDGTGMLYRVYAQRISPFWSVNASYQSSTRDFAQIGQMGRTDRPREILQLSAGLTMGAWGNVNASESFIRRVDDDKARITTFSYNRRLGRVGNINAFLLNSRATGTPDATTVGLSFSMSLGSNTSLYAQADSDARRIEINKALPSDRGWGYRLYAEDAERDQQAADISYRGRAFEISGQARRSGGQTGFRMLANGGLLLAGGSVFPTQRLDSGFAIVDVGGQKDVRVFQDNREVTRTNGSGVAVVTQLRPYESNRISVASDDLHLDTSMKNDTIMVVPRPLGGVFTRFGISEGRAGTVVIEVADGQPLEPGTPVTIEGDENGTFAGYGGEVFVENIVAGMRLTATRRQGVCSVVLPAAPAEETLPRIGPLRCSQAGQ
jgi:outer membrane usher protein